MTPRSLDLTFSPAQAAMFAEGRGGDYVPQIHRVVHVFQR